MCAECPNDRSSQTPCSTMVVATILGRYTYRRLYFTSTFQIQKRIRTRCWRDSWWTNRARAWSRDRDETSSEQRKWRFFSAGTHCPILAFEPKTACKTVLKGRARDRCVYGRELEDRNRKSMRFFNLWLSTFLISVFSLYTFSVIFYSFYFLRDGSNDFKNRCS